MRFAFIAVEKAAFPVGLFCRTLGVSRCAVGSQRSVSISMRAGSAMATTTLS